MHTPREGVYQTILDFLFFVFVLLTLNNIGGNVSSDISSEAQPDSIPETRVGIFLGRVPTKVIKKCEMWKFDIF